VQGNQMQAPTGVGGAVYQCDLWLAMQAITVDCIADIADCYWQSLLECLAVLSTCCGAAALS